MRHASRFLAPLGAVAALLALPATAHAQDSAGGTKDCPPGSWFCGDTQPPVDDKDLQPLPQTKPTETKPAAAPPAAAPTTRDAPPAYTYVPRQPKTKREWGLNLHGGGLMIGSGRSGNAGMGMAGLGLRYRPIPHMGIEADVDFAGGRDYYGFRRSETALSFNGLLFVNPQNKLQLYFLGGFGFSGAHAVDDRSQFNRTEYHYGYFGLTIGAGVELRLSKVIALNLDVRGFVRGRIDDDADRSYEFTDRNGRGTNASGGGLVQGGLTFYW